MYSPIKLSVSSILLAGVMTGCSQQQIQQDPTTVNIYQATPQAHYKKHSSKIKVRHKVHKKNKRKKNKHKNKYKKRKAVKKIKRNIGLPPAKPGQCYAKVKQPAVYKTLTKRVLVRKASDRRVFVRGPQYRWISKRVLARPASYTQRVIPAVYKTINKRVMVKPAYLKWKKGKGLITRIDNSTGEILCRVKVPAVYKNIRRKVLVRPAKIIKTPRPAVYKTVKTKKIVSPPLYKTVRTPARYTNKTYRVKKTSAKYIWRQVICETNTPRHYKKKKFHKKSHKAKFYRAKAHSKKYAKRKKQPRKTRTQSSGRKHLAQKRKNYRKTSHSRKKSSSSKIRKAMHTSSQKKKSNQPKTPFTKANAVLRIQTALSERGFYLGKIDGKLGATTVAALTTFQRQHGLATGRLNRATLKALELI